MKIMNEAKDMNKSFLVDSLGTIVVGCLGTSVVGTTLETSAVIEEGGRTGLMAVTSAVKAIDFDNITEAIPAFFNLYHNSSYLQYCGWYYDRNFILCSIKYYNW